MKGTIRLSYGTLTFEDGEWEFDGLENLASMVIERAAMYMGQFTDYTPTPFTSMVEFVAEQMEGTASFDEVEHHPVPPGAIP